MEFEEGPGALGAEIIRRADTVASYWPAHFELIRVLLWASWGTVLLMLVTHFIILPHLRARRRISADMPAAIAKQGETV